MRAPIYTTRRNSAAGLPSVLKITWTQFVILGIEALEGDRPLTKSERFVLSLLYRVPEGKRSSKYLHIQSAYQLYHDHRSEVLSTIQNHLTT